MRSAYLPIAQIATRAGVDVRAIEDHVNTLADVKAHLDAYADATAAEQAAATSWQLAQTDDDKRAALAASAYAQALKAAIQDALIALMLNLPFPTADPARHDETLAFLHDPRTLVTTA